MYMLKEFKEFAMKGNVMSMAIGDSNVSFLNTIFILLKFGIYSLPTFIKIILFDY